MHYFHIHVVSVFVLSFCQVHDGFYRCRHCRGPLFGLYLAAEALDFCPTLLYLIENLLSEARNICGTLLDEGFVFQRVRAHVAHVLCRGNESIDGARSLSMGRFLVCIKECSDHVAVRCFQVITEESFVVNLLFV
jgi:hypothetical protein